MMTYLTTAVLGEVVCLVPEGDDAAFGLRERVIRGRARSLLRVVLYAAVGQAGPSGGRVRRLMSDTRALQRLMQDAASGDNPLIAIDARGCRKWIDKPSGRWVHQVAVSALQKNAAVPSTDETARSHTARAPGLRSWPVAGIEGEPGAPTETAHWWCAPINAPGASSDRPAGKKTCLNTSSGR